MTGNREDYIKVIYELGGERYRISTNEIAKALDVSAPSVSEMLKKLKQEDILEYEVYKGVTLTKKGVKQAVRIKKIHILWEVFLVEKLGYDLADVHVEAELLEHITSPKLAARLEEFLDYPKKCPHGTPLNYNEHIFDYIRLSEVSLDKNVILKRFLDDKDFLLEVAKYNLNIGDIIKIIESNDDHYKLLINNNEIILSLDLANNIFVVKE